MEAWGIGRVEPRLFDAALSWCCEHGDLVNQKRLGKLVDELDDEQVTTVGAAWGGNAEEYGDSSWTLDPSDEAVTPSETARGLFLDEQLDEQIEAAATNGNLDEHFEAVGWQRGRFEPRRDLQATELRRVENLQLFCRRFFGMGRRAEVMTPLMYGLELSTADLAELTMYSRRSVQTVLRDLRTGQKSLRVADNGRVYAISSPPSLDDASGITSVWRLRPRTNRLTPWAHKRPCSVRHFLTGSERDRHTRLEPRPRPNDQGRPDG
jgi:hypothetical protein